MIPQYKDHLTPADLSIVLGYIDSCSYYNIAIDGSRLDLATWTDLQLVRIMYDVLQDEYGNGSLPNDFD